ncbi:MAG: hypothetical protein EP330_18245 [Deltaproteobacteria bacterium]|nr:MAG: hypothetical protein EP330_18245 [Deltaproteobacteria bacterium]
MTLLSLVLLTAAFAEEPAAAPAPAPAATKSVTLPTGKTIDAKVVTPAADTLEAWTVEAMKLAEAGDHDKWIRQFCGPTLCEGPTAVESVKRLNLASAQRTVSACHEGDTIVVTREKGDRNVDDQVTLYTWCGDGRMPAPVTWEKVGDDWKIRSFSW